MPDDRRGATPEAARAALDRAIEEKPGAVIDFVERLDRANAVLDTTSLATSAIDDTLVNGLAETSSALLGGDGNGGSAGTLATAIGTNPADLERALRTLSRLERDGTLDELAATGETLREVEDAVGDDAVALASDPEVAGDVGRLLRAVEAAGEEETELGTLGLLQSLRDEEVQQGLSYLVALAREIGEQQDDDTV
ncbi:DUF1641 domain-containing protein [Halorarius litoreus]|uniref:DUF1641 domain-containing protein n=1 Tax=Halorarius litoreus TaxID=2962676 RepID=UPI0020CE51FF|nr:DUF1641 domain-containing protein [Halorarius litoreus]